MARFNAAKIREKRFGIFDLLVVAVIAGILGAIVYASFASTQARARDARRLSDIDAIKKALALYKNDNKKYPISAATTTLSGEDDVAKALEGTDITVMPRDPLWPQYEYTYRTDATGAKYYLSFCMETKSNRNYSQGCTNTIKP